MALADLAIEPGIYTEGTGRSSLNRWKNGNNVRPQKGLMEKIGGWEKAITTQFSGICRALLGWQTLSFQNLLALGTHKKLLLADNDEYFNITPIADDGTLGTDPFTTTNGQSVVSVEHVAHGRAVGDGVIFDGSTAVAGLDMDGEWEVSIVVDDDNYLFVHTGTANASTSGGGAATDYEYEISPGTPNSVLGSGWGAGGWGTGTWGTPRTSAYLTLARIWSLVNWGEDLIASPVDREIYVWQASGGTGTRATLITQAPAQSRCVLLSPQLRILISFGSHDGTSPDPMLIRWCHSEDYTDWTPTASNLAGDKRLDKGTEIIGVLQSRNEIVILTDTTVYSMYLTGNDDVFGFDDKGKTVGLAGPNAACDINGTVYAMGRGQFFTYDGQVLHLPCDVHSRIFGDINILQAAKIHLRRNKNKNEFIGFYCSAGSDEIDRVFGCNLEEPGRPRWWLGDETMARTAWLDEHPFDADPLGCGVTDETDGTLYTHETGVNADGAALPYELESYDVEIGANDNSGPGETALKITGLIPDFRRIAGTHELTMTGKKKPNGASVVKGPKAFNASSTQIDMHIRARQIAIKVASNAVDSDISMGLWRFKGRAMGGR